MQHDDLIDFPCSPTYASYFAHIGITQDYPREYYEQERKPSQSEFERTVELHAGLERQERQIAELQVQVQRLQSSQTTRPKIARIDEYRAPKPASKPVQGIEI